MKLERCLRCADTGAPVRYPAAARGVCKACGYQIDELGLPVLGPAFLNGAVVFVEALASQSPKGER